MRDLYDYQSEAWKLRTRMYLANPEHPAVCADCHADLSTVRRDQLNVHHKHGTRWREGQEPDWALQVLCVACHKRHHAIYNALKASKRRHKKNEYVGPYFTFED